MRKIFASCYFFVVLLIATALIATMLSSCKGDEDKTEDTSNTENVETLIYGKTAIVTGDSIVKSSVKGGSLATTSEQGLLTTLYNSIFPSASASIPISFSYNGKIYNGFDSNYNVTNSNGIITGTHKDKNLAVEIHSSKDTFHAQFEWYIKFKNLSSTESIELSDIFMLKNLTYSETEHALTYYSSYENSKTQSLIFLRPGMDISVGPMTDMSSGGTLPYFRYVYGSYGFILAIDSADNWGANFRAEYQKLASNEITMVKSYVSVRYEGVEYTLAPGEELKTPAVVIIANDAKSSEQHVADLFTAWRFDCAEDRFRDNPWQ